MKELNPNIKIIGIDPHGSDLALPADLNNDKVGYQIEGIGYDFIPQVCDRSLVDEWIKSSDEPSFPMCRRLIGSEGMLVGGSSGSSMHYALEYIKKHKIGKGKRVVVICADGVRNYMTKFLNADWMNEYGFMSEEEVRKLNESRLVPSDDLNKDKKVSDLKLADVQCLTVKSTC